MLCFIASVFSGGTLWIIIGIAVVDVAAVVVIVAVKKKKILVVADGAAVGKTDEEEKKNFICQKTNLRLCVFSRQIILQ